MTTCEFITEEKDFDKYLSDLQGFNTVIMGRRTYGFGFQYGLHPGKPAYDLMKHFIFSILLKIKNWLNQSI